MQVDDDAVALEVEHGDAEEEWHGRKIDIVQIVGELRVLAMVLEAIPDNDEEGEDSCDEKELEVAATGNLQDKYKRLNQGLQNMHNASSSEDDF